jgi:glutaredoxin
MAKDMFNTYGVPFEDYNVATDIARRSEMVEKSGQLGVPVIVVDDKDVIVGFDRERLVSLLGLPA